MNLDKKCECTEKNSKCCGNKHVKRVAKLVFAGTVTVSLVVIAYSLVELNNGHKIDSSLLEKRSKQLHKLAKKHGKTAKKLAQEKSKHIKKYIA